MSVTENGPEGYDYQYLASIYVILHFWNKGGLTAVYIDRLGNEDLTLSINDRNGQQQTIEVQFKNRASSFDDGIFNSCITKFSAFKSDITILSRLQNGTADHFYIITSAVASGLPSRIHVAARPYTFEKSSGKTDDSDLQLLINNLDKDYSNPKTNIQKARKTFLYHQKSALTTKIVTNLLERVTLVDRLSKKEIIQVIGSYLTEHLVPVPGQRHVMLEYLELIKEKRGKGVDILPDLESLVAANSQNLPVPDPDYHPRGDEPDLITELTQKHVLLLTGLPLCGKTQTAIYIALKVIEGDKSIEYYATTDTRAAEQFLNSNEFGGRICYLEDPVNADQPGNKTVQYRQLESLMQNLPKGQQRYLIVTAPDSDVKHLTENGYLSGMAWQDLTVKNTSFLGILWERLTTVRSIPINISNLTKKLLSNSGETEKIQPGQLVFLSRHYQRLNLINQEALVHFINFRAFTITELLLKEGGDIMDAVQILAATSNIRSGANEKDLRYFSDDRQDYWPAINSQVVRFSGGTLFGTRAPKVYTIKEYEGLPAIKPQLENGLSKLIDYGYVDYQLGHYQFKHPIYREAARSMLLPGNPIRFKKAILYLHKAIACLNVHVGLQAARNLLFIASSCKEDEDLEAVILIGATGLSATFVSVRDQSLLFLISQFADLASDLQDRVREEIQKRSQSQSGTYVWQNDIAFIPDVEHLETDYDGRYRNTGQILNEWKQFQESNTTPDSNKAWDIVKSLDRATRAKKKRIAYNIASLRRFLNYDEGFIRGKAAYLLAASVTDKDAKLVKELFAVDDPLVNYQLIKGLFRSWPYFKSDTVKEEMKQFMIQAYDNLFIVLSSIELFSQFSAGHTQYTFDWMYDIEDSSVSDMWYLWGELMPVFFKHLPTSVHINTSRFTMTFKESQVSDATLVRILDAFINWLQIHIKDKGYHTYMAEIPVWFFSEKLDVIPITNRLNFIKKFLTIDNKVFQGTFWRHVVAQWAKLSQRKTSYLKAEMQRTSELIHSIILSTIAVPDEVEHEILGFSLTGKTAKEIVDQVPQSLLLSSLATLYLLPPFYDLPDKNTPVWNNVLVYLFGKSDHKGFDIALTVFFNDILILRYTREGCWDSPKQLLENILTTGAETMRETIFTKLLLDLMGTNTSHAKVYLDLLFTYCNEAEIERYSNDAVNNIEAISNSNNLFRLPGVLSAAVHKQISIDIMVFNMIGKKWIKEIGEEISEPFGKIMVMALQDNAVKTIEAIDLLRTWARANTTFFTIEEMEIIEGYMSRLHEKARQQNTTKEDAFEKRFREMVEVY